MFIWRFLKSEHEVKKKPCPSPSIRLSLHRYVIYNNNKNKNKSVAYSSQGSHTGQLDFYNWLADGSTTG